jgi:hypothetical protein
MKNLAKRMVTVIGGVTIAAFVLTLAAPKTVHAIVSTLVTVANTTANPVPVDDAKGNYITLRLPQALKRSTKSCRTGQSQAIIQSQVAKNS